MQKIDILRRTTVGERIAEQEKNDLNKYFIKTYLWEQIIEDKIDIVFGSKGSGKSAIYNSLSSNVEEIFDKNAILILAENPRGAVAFKNLNTSPPKTNEEFKNIWKLYFIMIISQKLTDYKYNDENFRIVIKKLEESNLITRRPSLSSTLKMVRDYIRCLMIEPNVSINENSGLINGLGIKISMNEPTNIQAKNGVVSLDFLFECLNESLNDSGFNVWLAIDRLDAIFQDNFELEANALKTLFQVYIDLMAFENIRLLIFFRDDIWGRIIEDGFREASHLTRKESIYWDESALFHLIMTRLVMNKDLLDSYSYSYKDLEFRNYQIEFFRKLFPKIINKTIKFNFKWLLSRIADGNKNVSPRELIHIINQAIAFEIKFFIETGTENTENFISEQSLKLAMRVVSKTKLDTVLAEYPKMQAFISKLKHKKIRSSITDLSKYWECSKREAKVVSDKLIKIGILKNENEHKLNKNPIYHIPFLYRSALGYSGEF